MKSSFYRTEMVYQKSNRRTSMSFQVICALRLQHWQGSFGPSAQEEIYMIIWYELAWGGCSHEILIICNIIFPNLFYWFSLSLSWSLSWVHPIDFQITVRHYKSFIFKLFKDWVPSKSKLQTLDDDSFVISNLKKLIPAQALAGQRWQAWWCGLSLQNTVCC